MSAFLHNKKVRDRVTNPSPSPLLPFHPQRQFYGQGLSFDFLSAYLFTFFPKQCYSSYTWLLALFVYTVFRNEVHGNIFFTEKIKESSQRPQSGYLKAKVNK